MELTALSKALWTIDILYTLSKFSSFMSVVSFIAMLVCIVALTVCKGCCCAGDHEAEKLYPFIKKATKIFVFVFLITFTINTIIPDKTTMNRIIAIEATSYVAQTEEAQKLKDKILNKINNMLEE